MFLTRSTVVSRLGEKPATAMWEDGSSYPVVDVDVSSESHPFWTGRGRVLDSLGRVEKFEQRYGVASRSAKEASR
jgi:large subunit ribosomal protein L31